MHLAANAHDIRYFFVTDRVQANEITIEYCPTGDMLADFFTKPLQGSVFRRFRNIIMNIQNDQPNETVDGSQECVGRNEENNMSE